VTLDIIDNKSRNPTFQGIGNLTPFDSIRASEAGKKSAANRAMRKAIAKLEVLRGWRIGVASVADNIKTVNDAIRATSAQIALQAYEGDSRAFSALMKAGGLQDTEKGQSETTTNTQNILVIGDAAAEQMARILGR
jgi:hypothetical protein